MQKRNNSQPASQLASQLLMFVHTGCADLIISSKVLVSNKDKHITLTGVLVFYLYFQHKHEILWVNFLGNFLQLQLSSIQAIQIFTHLRREIHHLNAMKYTTKFLHLWDFYSSRTYIDYDNPSAES